jgi:hypothetical protein
MPGGQFRSSRHPACFRLAFSSHMMTSIAESIGKSKAAGKMAGAKHLVKGVLADPEIKEALREALVNDDDQIVPQGQALRVPPPLPPRPARASTGGDLPSSESLTPFEVSHLIGTVRPSPNAMRVADEVYARQEDEVARSQYQVEPEVDPAIAAQQKRYDELARDHHDQATRADELPMNDVRSRLVVVSEHSGPVPDWNHRGPDAEDDIPDPFAQPRQPTVAERLKNWSNGVNAKIEAAWDDGKIRNWALIGTTVAGYLIAVPSIIAIRHKVKADRRVTLEKEGKALELWFTPKNGARPNPMTLDYERNKQQLQYIAKELRELDGMLDIDGWRTNLADVGQSLLLMLPTIPLIFVKREAAAKRAWLSDAIRLLGMVRAVMGDSDFLRKFMTAYNLANALRWPEAIKIPVDNDMRNDVVDWFESEIVPAVRMVDGRVMHVHEQKTFLRLDRVFTDLIIVASIFSFTLRHVSGAREPCKLEAGDVDPKEEKKEAEKKPDAAQHPSQQMVDWCAIDVYNNGQADHQFRIGPQTDKPMEYELDMKDMKPGVLQGPKKLEALADVKAEEKKKDKPTVTVGTSAGGPFPVSIELESEVETIYADCSAEDMKTIKLEGATTVATRGSKPIMIFRGYKIYGDDEYRVQYPLSDPMTAPMKGTELKAKLDKLDDEHGFANIGTVAFVNQTRAPTEVKHHKNRRHQQAAQEQEREQRRHEQSATHAAEVAEQKKADKAEKASRRRGDRNDEDKDVDMGNKKSGMNFGRVTRYDMQAGEVVIDGQMFTLLKRDPDVKVESLGEREPNLAPPRETTQRQADLAMMRKDVEEIKQALKQQGDLTQQQISAFLQQEAAKRAAVAPVLEAPRAQPVKLSEEEKAARKLAKKERKVARKAEIKTAVMEYKANKEAVKTQVAAAEPTAQSQHAEDKSKEEAKDTTKIPALQADIGQGKVMLSWNQRVIPIYSGPDCTKRTSYAGLFRGLLWVVEHENPCERWIKHGSKVARLSCLKWELFRDNHMWLAEIAGTELKDLGVRQWSSIGQVTGGSPVAVMFGDACVTTVCEAKPRYDDIQGATKIAAYMPATVKGDCGGPVVSLTNSTHGQLLGVHIEAEHFALFPTLETLAKKFPNVSRTGGSVPGSSPMPSGGASSRTKQ